jgi:archaellum component FlaF (FlaF/FlaG flagellin family)
MAQDYMVTSSTQTGTVMFVDGSVIEVPTGDVVSNPQLVSFLQTMPNLITLEAITATVANAIAGVNRPIVRH